MPEAEAGLAQYYVANSTGACISSSDTIAMGMSNSTIKTVPWTLEMYLKCSKIKYPSRARFHCVKRVCGEYYRFCLNSTYIAILKIWMRRLQQILVLLLPLADVDPTVGGDVDPTVGDNVDTNVDGIPSASLIYVFPSI